ncbi:MAG: hypothetical protein BMS9Abin26_1812 [Gammaproteobacteria bacterium]|nr:MAG: hypothetical protein BMS9Abin26_1812 [Gammaproteobacteria bacterium]
MPKDKKSGDGIDWTLTTWEGSRREALRRWAQLPLERIIAALEEMQELNEVLTASAPEAGGAVQEQQGNCGSKADGSNKPDKPDK